MECSAGAVARSLVSPRTVAGFLAAGCMVLVVAACGGSSPSARLGSKTNARSSAGAQSAIAGARCMRAHGVQHWPDPDRNGHFPKSELTLQRLGVTSNQLRTAQHACQQLFPSTGQSSSAQDQQMMNAMWKFARCAPAVSRAGPTRLPSLIRDSRTHPGFPGASPASIRTRRRSRLR
jgi:hypothetical protein